MLRYFSTALALLSASLPAWSADGREDYDVDKNGLIEIYDLADLNEVRNDLTGRTLYGSAAGCPDDGCRGIELMADLDFDTNGDGVIDTGDTYWNAGKGWEPIGAYGSSFHGIVEGNGYVIRNLYIDRPDEEYVGLFGHLTNTRVRRTGFAGSLTHIQGGFTAGMVAGMIQNTKIEAVFATGLIGSLAGGIVGYLWDDQSSLHSLFSTVKVSDASASPFWKPAGGLVGTMTGGTIINSFSMIPLIDNHTGGAIFDSYEVLEGLYDPRNRIPLAELTCPTIPNDPACSPSLFNGWDNTADTDGTSFWDYGHRLQLPGLVLNGRLFRDSDGDGLLDEEDDDIDGDGVDNIIDAFPDNPAASIDDNGNGLPDIWNPECDITCQEASELVLEELDSGPSAGAVERLFFLLSGLLGIATYRRNCCAGK